jgi:hypothetical protein
MYIVITFLSSTSKTDCHNITINIFHILHWATASEKYIILTLFYDQNYVNLSNLKFHPLSHKVFIFLKITHILTGKSLNLLYLYLYFHHLLIFIFIDNTYYMYIYFFCSSVFNVRMSIKENSHVILFFMTFFPA